MEDSEEIKFRVIISKTAEISFYEILDYLYDHYPLDKAEEVANEIRDTAKNLEYLAERGTLEPSLSHRKQNYRFILYNRTKRSDIKVIYYFDKSNRKVFITDFFPTEKDQKNIKT